MDHRTDKAYHFLCCDQRRTSGEFCLWTGDTGEIRQLTREEIHRINPAVPAWIFQGKSSEFIWHICSVKDNALIGIASIFPSSAGALLRGIWVAKADRKQGVGTRLLTACGDALRQGCCETFSVIWDGKPEKLCVLDHFFHAGGFEAGERNPIYRATLDQLLNIPIAQRMEGRRYDQAQPLTTFQEAELRIFKRQLVRLDHLDS